jgi:hypothetical protein
MRTLMLTDAYSLINRNIFVQNSPQYRNSVCILCSVMATAILHRDRGHMEGIDQCREEADRRRFGWRTVFFGFILSRRRAHRRDEEDEPLYSDWHHPWLFFLAIGTMILSCVDAFFTLQLLARGAIEINPIMDAVIGQSAFLFTVSKMLLTGFGILTLVFLSRARFMNRFRTGLILTVFFSFYCCLVCYEFVSLLGHT